MNTVLHKAESRGYANHGWLETYQHLVLQIIEILNACNLGF